MAVVQQGRLLIVEPHLVRVAQQRRTDLAHASRHLLAQALQLIGRGDDIVVRNLPRRSRFSLPGKVCCNETITWLVQVPGFAQRGLPVAHHQHGVVQAACGGGFQLGQESRRTASWISVGLQCLGDRLVTDSGVPTWTGPEAAESCLTPAPNERCK